MLEASEELFEKTALKNIESSKEAFVATFNYGRKKLRRNQSYSFSNQLERHHQRNFPAHFSKQ